MRANSSEDKMLGDYFVNPSDGVITDKVLLNKILFYLWNDVCKDGEGDIFKVGEAEDISFSELYGENGAKMLKRMMSYLGVTDPDGNKVTTENNDHTTASANRTASTSKVMIPRTVIIKKTSLSKEFQPQYTPSAHGEQPESAVGSNFLQKTKIWACIWTNGVV